MVTLCADVDVMHDPGNVADAHARRREAALAGHTGNAAAVRQALGDPDAGVRATALAALARLGELGTDDLRVGLADPVAATRGAACEVAARMAHPEPAVAELVLERLADEDPGVVEIAAWALGELGERVTLPVGAVAALARVATQHDDPLARESAVAALGALGDPAGLPAILAGTTDKPAVRRRAVLALAPFSGPEVDAALARAREDRDWQVREAAELLLRADSSEDEA